MKIKQKLLMAASIVGLLPLVATAAPNPASEAWVRLQIQQAIANLPVPTPVASSVLSASDWNAVCTTGTVSSASGCYGDASSAAFARLNTGLGDFTSFAGINNAGAPGNSVFIKAFLAGTNLPVNPQYLTINMPVSGGMARCGIFTQAGHGINGPEGINSSIPSDGSANFTGPQATHVLGINTTTVPLVGYDLTYNSNSNNPNFANLSTPLYFMCVGVNSSNGSTPYPVGNITVS